MAEVGETRSGFVALAVRVLVVLVDRERQHVGRPQLPAPGQVELRDPLRADELDRHVAVVDPRGRRRVGHRLLHAGDGQRVPDHLDIEHAQALRRRWSVAGRSPLACSEECWS